MFFFILYYTRRQLIVQRRRVQHTDNIKDSHNQKIEQCFEMPRLGGTGAGRMLRSGAGRMLRSGAGRMLRSGSVTPFNTLHQRLPALCPQIWFFAVSAPPNPTFNAL